MSFEWVGEWGRTCEWIIGDIWMHVDLILGNHAVHWCDDGTRVMQKVHIWGDAHEGVGMWAQGICQLSTFPPKRKRERGGQGSKRRGQMWQKSLKKTRDLRWGFFFCRFEIFKIKSQTRENIGGQYKRLYAKNCLQDISYPCSICACVQTFVCEGRWD